MTRAAGAPGTAAAGFRSAVPDDPRFTPGQRAELERIEAAQEAPEALRERVARALWETVTGSVPWSEADDGERRIYRRLADAALAVLSLADVPGDGDR